MVFAVVAAFAVIAVALVFAIRACYRGLVWGPVFAGLVLAGLGVILTGGYYTSVLGLLCLGGSVAAFACAREFRVSRGTQGRLPRGWKYGAAFLAVMGFALVTIMLQVILVDLYGFSGGGPIQGPP